VRHASFFSGVGGLDLGFERAGIETVSVSEIDPYANAVLAERFPDAPNLGSITEVDANDIPEADIWSGGFPCQDLSVAGKRAGFAGKRSSLAFTFLDLVEQRRPRWLVLENVPGLFSSNNGADFGRLLYEMDQLRYGVSWRTLDARYFGVAQRRRRVFLVASLESDRAGEVLLECEGCERHPSASQPQRQGAASGASDGSGVARTVRASLAKRGERGDGSDDLIISQAPDSDGVRAADGLARRLDDQSEVDTLGATTHRTLQARDWKPGVNNQDISALSRGEGFLVGYQTRADEKNGNFSITEAEVANSLSALWPGDTSHRSMTLVAPAVFRKSARAQTNEDSETWVEGDVANTLNSFDVGDVRTTHAIVTSAAAFKAGNSASARSIGYEEEISPSLEAGGGGNNKPTALIGTSYDGFNQKVEPDGAHRTIRIGRDSSDFVIALGGVDDDSLLPVGLDSHRYRCCGNGVVAPVAEWIGRRIVEVDRRWREEEAK